jgi:hypothetical protein
LTATGDTESSVRAAALDLFLSGNTAEPRGVIADLSSKIGDILIARVRELAHTPAESPAG